MLISKSLNASCDGAWALSWRMTREHAVEATCILLCRASASVQTGITIRISDTCHILSRLHIRKDLTQLYRARTCLTDLSCWAYWSNDVGFFRRDICCELDDITIQVL